jgi:hypothetical protein
MRVRYVMILPATGAVGIEGCRQAYAQVQASAELFKKGQELEKPPSLISIFPGLDSAF